MDMWQERSIVVRKKEYRKTNLHTMIETFATCLGFTAQTGKPILCIVIVAGTTQAYEFEVIIDCTSEVIGDPSDKDYFHNNRGKGEMFHTGKE